MTEFHFRLSKNKTVKYYYARCKKCHAKNVKRSKKANISSTCFYCGLTYLKIRSFKYCSVKCKSAGISERLKFKNELGIKVNPFYHGETY